MQMCTSRGAQVVVQSVAPQIQKVTSPTYKTAKLKQYCGVIKASCIHIDNLNVVVSISITSILIS